MCIVVDANVMGYVFSPSGDEDDFGPVREWIFKRKGRLVIGGSGYMEELKRVPSSAKAISELNKCRKVVKVENGPVDELEAAVRRIVPADCDDPHIIALIGVSRCPLVCTQDKRAFRYLRDRSLYPWDNFSPKIYSHRQNAAVLLTEENASKKVFTDSSCCSKFQSFIKQCVEMAS